MVAVALWLGLFAFSAGAGSQATLWEIGVADNTAAEFALAPNGFAGYEHDPLYVVGSSVAQEDWPYVQPGPDDQWAGSTQHSFSIVFGLAEPMPNAPCALILDLLDTHFGSPPELVVSVNGKEQRFRLPAGGADGSIMGQPEVGREERIEIPMAPEELRPGRNDIRLTSASGSWMVYDWIGFAAPEGAALVPVEGGTMLLEARSEHALRKGEDGAPRQCVLVTIHRDGAPVDAEVRVTGGEPVRTTLQSGKQTLEVLIPAVSAAGVLDIEIVENGVVTQRATAEIRPVRPWNIYLLHHSHVDIGYTHLQSEVEQKQCDYLEECVGLTAESEGNPPGEAFKWNSEVLWAVDSYLRNASQGKRDLFIEAVKEGRIGLDGMYGNQLTALCTGEELFALFACARRLSREYGLTIDCAMISDVPGWTWGVVPAMAHSGIRYLSMGPNVGHRIGFTREAWNDRPFYWVSPSGEEKVLCWMAGTGYSWFHGISAEGRTTFDVDKILGYISQLDEADYPYDMVQVRYNIGGDNGPPDPNVTRYVQEWNRRYASPRFTIATSAEMFHAFEARYADQIPSVRGDFTPYWEDGAASSAAETAMNRESAERIAQAGAMAAMLRPEAHNASLYEAAWREVLLYDEHTWGAHNSISEPDGEFALGQWAAKRQFAVDGSEKSRELMAMAAYGYGVSRGAVEAVHVFNTCSWPRTDLAVIPADWKLAGDAVFDAAGNPVPAQRLRTGELVFMAGDVPPFGAAAYTFGSGAPASPSGCLAEANRLSNGLIGLELDETTGAIRSLKWAGLEAELVDSAAGMGLNDYFYVAGRKPDAPQRNEQVRIEVVENGPVVYALMATSAAPGCRGLYREIRLIAGLARVDIVDTVDKEKVYEQEAVHFAFPFNVPEGVMRVDTPWALVRPEADQLPGACRNYLTAQRWVDVSNQEYGVTWATVDAPLIEVGAILCDPTRVGWLKRLEPSSTLYSYAMNNYWETNYKATQEGPTVFRYALQPHRLFDAADAERFGVGQRQPLRVLAARKDMDAPGSFLSVEPAGVIVTSLKPADDGHGWVARLYGASGRTENASLTWGDGGKARAWLADAGEIRIEEVKDTIRVAPHGIVTVRLSR